MFKYYCKENNVAQVVLSNTHIIYDFRDYSQVVSDPVIHSRIYGWVQTCNPLDDTCIKDSNLIAI